MKDLIQTLKYLEESVQDDEQAALDNYYLQNTISIADVFEETLAGYLSGRMNNSTVNEILKNSGLLPLIQQFANITNERVEKDNIVDIQKQLSSTLDTQFDLVDKLEQTEISNIRSYQPDDIRLASSILQSSIELATRYIKTSEDFWNSPENRQIANDLLDKDPRPHGMSQKDFF